ncbi:phosphatidylserine decarboxylase family protein [Methylobacter sp.]|uniref:phosphatidylserine decarboxylase family protein n=1 Tax=Methylobacter sp. TaxID=2051955 RepID=UPI002FDD77D4
MTTTEVIPFRVGEWLPSDQKILDNWLEDIIQEIDDLEAKGQLKPLHPVIEQFKQLIEQDPEIFMYFNQMFTQVPKRPPYNKSPTGKPQVKNYEQMLRLMNIIITRTPAFNETGLVGFPINAILDWSMGTIGGFAAFLNDKVNAQLKAILNQWGGFLKSDASCYALNSDPGGWFSPAALDALALMDPFYGQGDDPKNPKDNFVYNFQCNTDLPYWGFTSWDSFFTREFNEGRRPVASPDDDSVIVNACESAPYRVAYGVQLRDTFWIKAQPYSLEHMLANDEYTGNFVGGTVYQAFLSAKSYHRWHSPVSGTIVKAYVQDGSYYAEALSEGFDPSGPNDSQGYITEVATRALIFIEADNPDIGLMCFMPVGMAEVSSCDITVEVGQHVNKGDSLGTFHFGGSTHCLIFSPKVMLAFDLHGQTPGLNSNNIPVKTRIATVCSN